MEKLWYSQIDNVEKEERPYFKHELYKISFLFKVSFKGDKAFITYENPLVIDETTLALKSRALNNLKEFLARFRLYQSHREALKPFYNIKEEPQELNKDLTKLKQAVDSNSATAIYDEARKLFYK